MPLSDATAEGYFIQSLLPKKKKRQPALEPKLEPASLLGMDHVVPLLAHDNVWKDEEQGPECES
jgi:hypothetical protein